MNNPFESIHARLSKIEELVLDIKDSNTNIKTDKTEWLDLNDLVMYDPEKRSKPTFYGYVHNGEIPFHKRGKKLLFLKSEIDEWLRAGRKKTNSEIQEEAEGFLKNKGI